MIVFLFPETRYRRPSTSSSDTSSQTENTSSLNDKNEFTAVVGNSSPEAGAEKPLAQTERGALVTVRSQHQQNGRPSKQQFSLLPKLEYNGKVVLFRDIIAPLQIFFFPIILWATLSFGFATNCLLALNLTQSQVFAAPPYNFSPAQVGFVNFAFVVGGVIGLVTAGPVSDFVSMRATMRNNGVREAEMRLVALLPYLAICLVGMTVATPLCLL